MKKTCHETKLGNQVVFFPIKCNPIPLILNTPYNIWFLWNVEIPQQKPWFHITLW